MTAPETAAPGTASEAPTAATPFPVHDSFARVAQALRMLHGVEPPVDSARGAATGSDDLRHLEMQTDSVQRNLLLDLCGSDHRPLVDLLLMLGPTIGQRLAVDARGVTLWETRRAPIAHMIVATRFLQPDVARWTVDAWACALGVISASQVFSPSLQNAATPAPVQRPSPPPIVSQRGGRAVGAAAPRVTSRAAPATVGLGGTFSPALMPGAPSWAGGRGGYRIGRTPASAMGTRSPRVGPPLGGTVAAMSRPFFQLSGLEKLAIVALTILIAFIAISLARTFLNPRNAGRFGLGRRGIPNAVYAAYDSLVSDTVLRTMRDSAGASAGGRGSASTWSAADSAARVATGAATTPRGVPDAGAPDAARVIASSSTALAAARDSALDAAADSALVRDARLTAETMRAIVDRGVAGAYQVHQRVRSVDGSASCSNVADALTEARTTLEQFDHVPGSSNLILSSRAASGRLYDDGRFDIGPREGVTNGVRWTFRLRGRFLPSGFTAQSTTETFAIIRWGRTQSCVTIADLVGRRLTP